MRKSIATVSVSGTLTAKLDAIAAAEFDAVEIFENDLIGCPLSPEQIRAYADDRGLGIDLYQPFRDFEAMPAEDFRHNLRRAERKFELMAKLGTDLLLVCSNVSPRSVDDDDLAAGQLYELATQAAEHGIRIAYEALAWGRHVSGYQHSWEIVRKADHPNLGLCLDSFHILSRGHDPAPIRDIPGSKIFFLQLADAPVLGMDVLSWSRHHRCFPGQGAFDLTSLVGHTLAAGYRGPLSLEVFNDVFRQADGVRTADDAFRSLLLLEETLGLFDPGPPASIPGYAFAGVSGSEAVRDILRGLGFKPVGEHRSELWAAGAARVVVTPEPGPPLVSAVGLATDDPAAATARAAAYGAASEPGEPPSAANGQTALLFCGPDWQSDFGVVSPDAGLLTGIDHVALPVPHDRFDEEALFLRAILGLFPAGSADLADPHGLIRSRAYCSADGLRIAVNMPPPGGFPGTQHVAFGCSDIWAAAAASERRLAIPHNYYDDLSARYELPDETLARMRDLDILYDRDGAAEYWHFYTQSMGERLFFEVVQRTPGYDGLGAVNAHVRMAAQAAFPRRRRGSHVYRVKSGTEPVR
ncbi:MAG: TIM barrel protein [Streptosporangiaceae bacterium]|jgi:4-hydroxyphenylpyruvate dioxygenase